MESLRFCFYVIHFDIYMDYRLVVLKVLNYVFMMG